MKLIGITGKSGSGKTTLSNMIAEKEKVGVIHTDELLDRIKQDNILQVMECDNKGEPVSLKKGIIKFLYSNKYMFLLYIKMKGILLNRIIKDKIQELEIQGNDIIVIEGVHLRYYPIFKELDKRIILQREYIKRQESVLLRDKDKKVDKETFVMWDMPYKRSYYREKMQDYDYKIYNSSKQKLKQEADNIYKEMSIVTEKERRRQHFKKYECKVPTIGISYNNRNQERRRECKDHETR